jgi:hypothetical protein
MSRWTLDGWTVFAQYFSSFLKVSFLNKKGGAGGFFERNPNP